MTSPAEPPLASLSLTHVSYNPDDPLSLLSAWLALLPQALLIVYATTLFCTREVECALMLAGQLGCEAVNFILKRVIREERPKMMHGKGYGMPSSHAQFSAFFALYMLLLLQRRGLGGRGLQAWRRHVYSAAAVGGSLAVALSRIYLNYHTPKQVLVGYGAGLVCAVGWYVVTAAARGVAEGKLWRCGMDLGKCVWLRDRCLEVDLVVEGWKAETFGGKKRR